MIIQFPRRMPQAPLPPHLLEARRILLREQADLQHNIAIHLATWRDERLAREQAAITTPETRP